MNDEARFLRQLHQTITQHFNLAELQGLAFDLGTNWDELAGDTLSLKSQSLIGYMQRNGRLPKLLHLLQEDRPNLPWPQLPATPPTTNLMPTDAARTAVWNALYETCGQRKLSSNRSSNSNRQL